MLIRRDRRGLPALPGSAVGILVIRGVLPVRVQGVTGRGAWSDDGELAWDSTPLLARLRGKKADREID